MSYIPASGVLNGVARSAPGDHDHGKGPKQHIYVYGRTHPDAIADQIELAAAIDDPAPWSADWWWQRELEGWIRTAASHPATVTPIDGGTTPTGRQAFRVDCGCGLILDLRSRYAGDTGVRVDEVGAWGLHHDHVWRTIVHPAFVDRLETFHTDGHCTCCGHPTIEDSTP